ncbi:MAG TPA: hypothetical protein VFD62_16870 [Pyrinomonadaceae bacterium]|nr:hypothetical protein [Pyrinomonadaceae bacterium]
MSNGMLIIPDTLTLRQRLKLVSSSAGRSVLFSIAPSAAGQKTLRLNFSERPRFHILQTALSGV